jgi:tRNA-2-methylthio-N6-dimethylallyladenosine synthase
MDRTYTRAEYLALVDRIRARCPEIVLTTDIIAGFCSETDAEFAETEDLMRQVEYHSAYIFKYSERKNTIAARKYADDVPDDVKAARVTKLIEFQRAISLKKNREMIGKTVAVLVEGEGKRSSDQWMGRTDGNVVTVFPKTAAGLKPGSLASVRITDATITTLYGESV